MNSPDSLLRIYEFADIPNGTIKAPLSFIQLRDPDRVMPFLIVRENTAERWLTGGDLDPESFVEMPDGSFWVGDEFGPFLVHFSADGRLLSKPIELGNGLRSPDFPGIAAPDAGQQSPAKIRRSRGFEGLAANANYQRLYAALEAGPVSLPPGETRIYEFDPAAQVWTGVWFTFPLGASDRGLTELIGLDEVFPMANCANQFLAIVRDNEFGDAARWKRVFKISHETDDVIVTALVADLLDIDNPSSIGGFGRIFKFPYITTESLWPTSRDSLLVVNDNNYPATGGRGPMKDVTEFIRLKLAQPLCR